ncbi:hypothetical protein BRADI_4g39055v3 [Brachypodium distachyon]|uniref:Uncharacterized protein n=1 Tax=Brachypodium distachyon TaxID=15368 RepID=A0A0Q3EVY7_BRADI|nr:hypothetical protein BRADI_4g39055v3 [Brachypodium distachyon]
MSQEATSRPPPQSGVGVTSDDSCSSDSDGSSISSFDMDDFVWEYCILDDPMEEWMEDLVVAQLLRGATPAQRRRIKAQREESRAKSAELRRAVEAWREQKRARKSRDRAQRRTLKKHTDLLRAPTSPATRMRRGSSAAASWSGLAGRSLARIVKFIGRYRLNWLDDLGYDDLEVF